MRQSPGVRARRHDLRTNGFRAAGFPPQEGHEHRLPERLRQRRQIPPKGPPRRRNRCDSRGWSAWCSAAPVPQPRATPRAGLRRLAHGRGHGLRGVEIAQRRGAAKAGHRDLQRLQIREILIPPPPQRRPACRSPPNAPAVPARRAANARRIHPSPQARQRSGKSELRHRRLRPQHFARQRRQSPRGCPAPRRHP